MTAPNEAARLRAHSAALAGGPARSVDWRDACPETCDRCGGDCRWVEHRGADGARWVEPACKSCGRVRRADGYGNPGVALEEG